MKGTPVMTSDEAVEPGDGETGPLPFDTSVAHQARIFDFLLGGKDNYAADRAAAEAVLQIYPETVFAARGNRAFLGRAIRYLAADAGIRQFLDIGTGIPTAGNTHEVAQAIAPESRVVYTDYDPVVLAHARALLTSGEAGATEYIHADLRDTGTILAQAGQLLDFTKPVAVTLLAVLHVIPDADNPHAIVAKLTDALPPGSYLAISHGGTDLVDRSKQESFQSTWNGKVQQRFAGRTREQVARFFTGLDLVEPGLVPVEQWRPDPGSGKPDNSAMWGAVARKR
jgi:hypothetical protein